MAAGVLALAESWRPDLVIHEDSEQGSWIAAERLGIPHVGLQATAWRGSRHRLSSEPLNRFRATLDLPADPGLERWHRFGFLTTRPPALHDPADPMPPGTRPIRPVASDEAGGEPATWPDGPADRRVVVTMGTVVPGRTATLAAILDGLEELGVAIVATVGHDLDPASLGARPATTRIARYVPMSAILETASLLVFHGGSGTMLASLAAGVPMVALPVAADQPENADRCVAAGVALALDPDTRDAAGVREAAARVLGDPSFRTAALALRAQIRDMPGPEVVLRDLERLVAHGRW
jgi:UDP:flavonoid glycosyltransferase YjiC (YdhE family)